MKIIIAISAALLITISSLTAQDSKIVEKEFKVFGNCTQCKTRIEKAVKIDEVKYSKWNKSTKMLKVAFENSITVDSLQRRLADVGHDTEKYKAKDETYAQLPKCCLYRDSKNTH
jgi:cation transport ATPase